MHTILVHSLYQVLQDTPAMLLAVLERPRPPIVAKMQCLSKLTTLANLPSFIFMPTSNSAKLLGCHVLSGSTEHAQIRGATHL